VEIEKSEKEVENSSTVVEMKNREEMNKEDDVPNNEDISEQVKRVVADSPAGSFADAETETPHTSLDIVEPKLYDTMENGGE